MFDPKAVAIGATIGFALSFFIGLFSGASFVIVFVRALFLGVFSGGFVFTVRYAVTRFLPELTENLSRTAEDDGATGTAVNITIDANEPDRDIFSSDGLQNIGEMVPDFLAGQSREAAVPSGAKGSGEFVPTYPVRETMRAQGDTIEPASSSATGVGATKGKEQPRTTIGGLDVLPDIQDFVPQSRDGDEGGEEGDNDAKGSVETGFGAEGQASRSAFHEADIKMSGIESETMAKAIRTILTREG